MATSYTASTNTDPSKAVFGESSAGVMKLQAQLNVKGANLGTPDGKYGVLTQQAFAKYGTPAVPVAKAPVTSVSATGLTSPAPMKTVTPTPDPLTVNGVGQGIINSAVASVSKLQAEADASSAKNQSTLDSITSLQTQDSNKAVDTSNLMDSTGANAEQANLDAYNQQMRDINANVAGLANEAKAIPLNVQQNNQNTGATDAGVAPQSAGMLRENAIKALTQSSLADVMTANINNSTTRYNSAVAKTTQAIDLKYKPIEDQIANLKDQLAMNKQYITDPAEKKLADAQTVVLNARTEAVATAKADTTATETVKLNLLNLNGANLPKEISTALTGATSVAQILAIPNIAKYFEPKVLDSFSHFTDPNTGITTMYNTKTGIASGTFGAGNPNVIPATTNNAIPPANTYAIKTGDSAYTIAQKNGTDVATIQALNPQIKDISQLNVGDSLVLPAGESKVAPYSQYGLLSKTTYNPANATDRNAMLYLSQYLQGITPSTRSMGISVSKGAQVTLDSIAQRARDLFSTATGNPLPPDPEILKGYVTLIKENNTIANNLAVQNGTIEKNFGLNLANATTANINQFAPPIINDAINSINAFFGNPATLTYYLQNTTLQQEAGNLLAVRNASGTTVYDKMAGAGLIPKNASLTAQADMMKTLLKEATNISNTINGVNNNLYKQTDPLQLDSNNPARQATLNGGTTPAEDIQTLTTFGKASAQNDSIVQGLRKQFPAMSPSQILQTMKNNKLI